MSAFTEAQHKELDALIDSRLRRIIEAGLMYAQPSQHITVQTPEPQTPINAIWQEMPASHKGPWEKTTDLNNPDITQLICKLKEKNTPIQHEGYTYWLLTNQTSRQIEGVGRRQR